MTINDISKLVAACPPARDQPRLDMASVFGISPKAPEDHAASLATRPDLGWVAANRLAAGPGGLKAVPSGKPYRWVRAAVALLGGTSSPDTATALAASRLSRDTNLRPVLEAALLAPDGTPEAVARALGLERETIECFADLFWNVVDRRQERAYLHRLAHGNPADGFDADELPLKAIALKTDLATVLAAAGYGTVQAPADGAKDLARRTMAGLLAEARVWIAAGGLNQHRPPAALGLALRVLGNMNPADLEPPAGSGGSALSRMLYEAVGANGAAMKAEFAARARAEELNGGGEPEHPWDGAVPAEGEEAAG